MSSEAPHVESARSLRPLCEIFEPKEDGNLRDYEDNDLAVPPQQ